MKIISLILLASCSILFGQADSKKPLSKYRQLWEKSLVTVPPDPPDPDGEDEESVLDDYVLGGWTQTTRGYVVALINTKNPKDRLTIAPGLPNKEGFKVVDTKRDPSDYKSSRVLVQAGTKKKWIGYEDKFLTIQQPPAAQRRNTNQTANQQRPGQQRNIRQPSTRQSTTRQNQTNSRQPPIPTNTNRSANGRNTNTNSNATNQQNSSSRRTPRVRRVPVPPRN